MLVKRGDGLCLNLDKMLLFEETSIDFGSDKNRPSLICISESGYQFTVVGLTLTMVKSYPIKSIINAEWITPNCKFASCHSPEKIKVELANTDKVNKLRLYVDRFLLIVGHPEALITDESYVSDMLSLKSKQRLSQIRKLKKAFGINTKFSITNLKVYELAEYIQKNGG